MKLLTLSLLCISTFTFSALAQDKPADNSARNQRDRSGETKTAVVTREGGRISYKLPFDAPSIVIEGDKLTATAEGLFVDYWERVSQ